MHGLKNVFKTKIYNVDQHHNNIDVNNQCETGKYIYVDVYSPMRCLVIFVHIFSDYVYGLCQSSDHVYHAFMVHAYDLGYTHPPRARNRKHLLVQFGQHITITGMI